MEGENFNKYEFLKILGDKKITPINFFNYINANKLKISEYCNKLMNIYLDCFSNENTVEIKEFRRQANIIQSLFKEHKGLIIQDNLSQVVNSILFLELDNSKSIDGYLNKNVSKKKRGSLKQSLEFLFEEVSFDTNYSEIEKKQYLKLLDAVMVKIDKKPKDYFCRQTGNRRKTNRRQNAIW